MAQQIFGARAGMGKADTGVRRVASTYGKPAFYTHAAKASGTHVVDGESERLVAQLLSFDPNVRTYRTQPLTLDLAARTILRTAEEKKAARARHKGSPVKSSFYTPDFLVTTSLGTETAIEVKSEAHLGDETYQQMLALATEVLWANGIEFMRLVVPSYWRHPLHCNGPLVYQAMTRGELRPGPEVLEQVEQLAERGASTLGDYCAGLGTDIRESHVLVAFGALSVDLIGHDLRSATPASPAYGALDHLSLIGRLAQ